jgi:hypothetical protein
MTFKSCPMVYHPAPLHCEGSDWPEWDEQEGHFGFFADLSHIFLVLPTPNASVCILPIDGSRGWQWDGNREKPTITPSIFHDPSNPRSGHHWHGFVTAGEMKGC